MISPDKKAADEYVVLPLSLEPTESLPWVLRFEEGKPLGKRLIPSS